MMTFPGMDQNAKDWIQAASWVAAVAAGLFGIIKIVSELKQGRLQREEELKWRRAEAAKSLNDALLADQEALAAMLMLDWDGREFEIKPGVKAKVTTEGMLASLRTVNKTFPEPEAFVRDSFDRLFYHLGIFQHYAARGLVDFKDIEQPIEYYVGLMAANRPVFENYLKSAFKLAPVFLENFPVWKAAGAVGPDAPLDTALPPAGRAPRRSR